MVGTIPSGLGALLSALPLLSPWHAWRRGLPWLLSASREAAAAAALRRKRRARTSRWWCGAGRRDGPPPRAGVEDLASGRVNGQPVRPLRNLGLERTLRSLSGNPLCSADRGRRPVKGCRGGALPAALPGAAQWPLGKGAAECNFDVTCSLLLDLKVS